MNLQPLAEAALAIQLHVASIVPAFVLGTWLIFFSTKGSRYHRLAGKTYLTLMAGLSHRRANAAARTHIREASAIDHEFPIHDHVRHAR